MIPLAVKKLQQLLAEEAHLSPALRSTLDVLLAMQLLFKRLSLTSRNSSQPPSKDRFPVREKSVGATTRKPGGQPGRVGTTLKKIDDPDEIETLSVDRSTLTPGDYRDIGYDCRQVFDIEIRRMLTEYRTPILEDPHGQRFTAPFPANVSKAVQYGNAASRPKLFTCRSINRD